MIATPLNKTCSLWPFLSLRRIIRLDDLRRDFFFCRLIRLKQKAGHKTHYLSGRT